MRDPQSKPTIITEDGEYVVNEAPTSGGAGRGDKPFSAGSSSAGFPNGAFVPGAFAAGGIPPIPERMLNKNGKPSLFKMIGWKGTAILVLVVAGIITLAVLSFMALLFILPILAVILLVGWVVGKVRGPQSPTGAPTSSIVVVRRRI